MKDHPQNQLQEQLTNLRSSVNDLDLSTLTAQLTSDLALLESRIAALSDPTVTSILMATHKSLPLYSTSDTKKPTPNMSRYPTPSKRSNQTSIQPAVEFMA
eukprot:TRINITY_DN82520_c0_g1_i1.p1 TRINITY_DN82520_c0_g1~~TRINITY_DN82520_c0_g1_i1.p1  ORF type:complete len:101 (-),score=9.50 TRINITY_DN82520_c0_g1_i1:201-503(-)